MMVKIKKALKLVVFVCLIFLAGIGVGLSGGVPIPLTNSRRDAEKDNIELIENEDANSGLKQNHLKE